MNNSSQNASLQHATSDMVVALQQVTLHMKLVLLLERVDGLTLEDITITAGYALTLHRLRYHADDIDIHLSPVTYELFKRLNPELIVRHSSLGERVDLMTNGNSYTFFCLGDIDTEPMVVPIIPNKKTEITRYRVLKIDQLVEQKWILLKMRDRSWKKKRQDLVDMYRLLKKKYAR